ncbi:MAG: RelA/SpoT domain-containing protein [Candidatus Nanopelagicaceae bacterium]
MTRKITKREEKKVEAILAAYASNEHLVEQFLNQVVNALQRSQNLSPHIHSIKQRIKDPEHLRDKLQRKIIKAKSTGVSFDVTPDNLLTKINDLSGIRILHLYTRQIKDIDLALRSVFKEFRIDLLEGPFARTWDDESRKYFHSIGIDTEESPTLYTSVHYVVGSDSQQPTTCEIQVRTLMEEVWGEVDHLINYPSPTSILASSEQLAVLARVTSSATRLVDSIFITHKDALKEDGVA